MSELDHEFQTMIIHRRSAALVLVRAENNREWLVRPGSSVRSRTSRATIELFQVCVLRSCSAVLDRDVSGRHDAAQSDIFTPLVLAAAVLGQGEVEEACHLGSVVLPQVRATSSARCVGYLDAFARSVRPYRGQPTADRFLNQARAVVSAAQ